jgi:hypothetical protein
MVVSEVDAMPDLVELVALGVGIALLPRRALQLGGDRAVGLTTDPSITRDLLLVTPLDRAVTSRCRVPRTVRSRIANRHSGFTSQTPRAGRAGAVSSAALLANENVHGACPDHDSCHESRCSSLGFGWLDEAQYLGRHRTVDDHDFTDGPSGGDEPLDLASGLPPDNDPANEPSKRRMTSYRQRPLGTDPQFRGVTRHQSVHPPWAHRTSATLRREG